MRDTGEMDQGPTGRRRIVHTDFRIILVGDVRTGKTAFAEQLLFRAGMGEYFPTVLDGYSASGFIDINSIVSTVATKRYSVSVMDTSGKILWWFAEGLTCLQDLRSFLPFVQWFTKDQHLSCSCSLMWRIDPLSTVLRMWYWT